jgi:diacylglycerol O-acyltransferase
MQAAGDRLSALDAAFLYLERPGQLLHVGGVYTVDGTLDFQRQLDDLAARLHLIPRYTQRVLPVPLNFAHPTWEDDPHFDLRNHVFRHTLRPPADDAQLAKLSARLFAQPLDRTRPLWEVHQIDGYQGDRSAIFAKVHHAMIDGVSGVQLLGVMFDPSPNPVPGPPPPTLPAMKPRLPSASTQLRRALAESSRTVVDEARALAGLLSKPRRAAAVVSEATDTLRELGRQLFATAPPTPFNGHVGTGRNVAWATLDLNEVKAVKNRLGGTVNDVILATISAAIRGYLESCGLNPDRIELRAMCPVNVRTAQENLKLGNRVSMMMAPLPVGIFDPLERLRQVRTAMAQLKASGQSSRMTRLIEMIDLLPPALQMVVSAIQMAAAPINTVCTNIPGPPVSLYVQGKRLETLVPLVPLAQGVGLAFAILSYADTITIGITAEPALVPEVERFAPLLRAGLAELSALAGIEPTREGPVLPELVRRRQARGSRVA